MSMLAKSIVGGLAGIALMAGTGGALADPGQATASVNVRSGPGINYRVIDTLYPGEDVDIRNCEGTWCYVVHSGPDGWVSASYLSGVDEGYYEPAYPIYVEPAPIYVTPPQVIIRPHHRHHVYHPRPPVYPGKPIPPHWTGKPTIPHNWQGKPKPPAFQGNQPHPSFQGNQRPPFKTGPSKSVKPGNGGDICKLQPQVCQNGPFRKH